MICHLPIKDGDFPSFLVCLPEGNQFITRPQPLSGSPWLGPGTAGDGVRIEKFTKGTRWRWSEGMTKGRVMGSIAICNPWCWNIYQHLPTFTNIYQHLPPKWPSHLGQYSIVLHTWSIWDTKMGVPIFARWMVDFMENIRTNMDDLKVPLADLENLHNISIWWFLTMGNPQVTISFKTNMVYNELNYLGVPPL